MNFNDKTAVTESEILCGWSKYVIELATPLDGITFDYDFKTQIDKDVKNLNKLYSDHKLETESSGSISGHRQRNSPFSEKWQGA